ncbi:hypothetical protein D770_07090 [Flammeovirgaceae bacterium 311]|nr:hypothetical protein D770_07090 [Flammeovirgaceae bacterium 311]
MYKYYYIFAAFLFCASCSQENAQTAPDTTTGPAAQTTNSTEQVARENTAADADGAMRAARVNFERQYPNATDVEWEEDANGYYEATFKQDGNKLRADYTQQGAWVETETSLKYDDLPKAVQEVIESDYNKDEITEIELVQHSDRGEFYDVEFKQKGKNMDVEIRDNGEVINQ